MTAPQLTPLIDLPARARNLARAQDMLWQQEAIAEVKDRLELVKKPLTDIAIVTDFPQLWQGFDHDGVQPSCIIRPDERLALAQGSFDLVIHAMALHWANDPVGQLVQCRRALRPDGLMMALMFGGQTLHELRASLAEAEAEIAGGLSPRVVPMGEIRDLGALLQRAGFALPVADSYSKVLRYRDVYHLMTDLRRFGEANALAARPRRFARRALFARADQIYRAAYGGADGRIAASFDLVCLTGWAAHDSQQKPLKPGSAAMRLADALAQDDRAQQKEG